MSLLREVILDCPITGEALSTLELGDVVYLNGIIYTGREGLYRKVIDENQPTPVDFKSLSNVNFHCSPAASVNDDGSYDIGAVTATASFRFSKWIKQWFKLSNCRVIIGKGGMSEQDYKNFFVPNNAIYLTTVGYGTGALLGRGITRVLNTYWLQELGIAQAVWVLEVQRFGPFLVESDLKGDSLFEQSNRAMKEKIDGLYKGLKTPALRRYGETISREDEVI